jgi:hypothetical protein
MPRRIAATIAGGVALAVGAWGALVPYIGHAIHYSADGSSTWTWNLQHGLLSLLPGAVAVGGALLLVGGAWIRQGSAVISHRIALGAASVLLGLSAVWFLIGTAVWPIYWSSSVLAPASPVRTFANLIGYHLGEGLVLAVLSGAAAAWTLRSLPRRSRQTSR